MCKNAKTKKQYVVPCYLWLLAKIRALYGENTDKILVHVQSVIDLFAKQLNNALNLHYVYHQNTGVIRFSTNARKYRRAPIYSGDMATLGGGCGC